MPDPIRYERERVLPLPPDDAWAILSDTDRLNRAIGLPPIEFGPPGEGLPPFVRRARARVAGLVTARWREYPFDWVSGRWYAVRRDFDDGPLRRLVAGAEVSPHPAGCRVRVFAHLTPRHALARIGLPLVGPLGLERTLAYCERQAAVLGAAAAPASSALSARPAVDRPALEAALASLARAPVRADLVPRLRALVETEPDAAVVRVRPYRLADAWGADRREVLRLFFHATRAGLFDLEWQIVCPACRVPKEERRSLADLPDRFHCDTCRIDYAVDFERRVELRFSVDPAVRSAEDAVYCIGSPFRTPHIVAQQYLEPAGRREITVPAGTLLTLRAVAGGERAAVEGAAGAVSLRYGPGGWTGGATSNPVNSGIGDVRVAIENGSPGPLLAVLETDAPDDAAVTAAEVTLLQEFRDLFGAEVLAPGHEVGISTVAILFTDLEGSTAFYEAAGDAPAYGSVRRHFDFLREQVAAREGAVIKTIGDAVMAAFRRAGDALGAALAMQAGIGPWCAAQGIDPPLALKIGVHRGPAIAVTANGRLDYFGRTVNLAARIQRQAAGGDIVLPEALWRDSSLQALAAGQSLAGAGPGSGISAEPFEAVLRGVPAPIRLVRLRATD